MVDFTKIHQFRAELEAFLLENSKYQEFQDEIDKELAKCGTNKHNRMVILQQMMINKVKELKKQVDLLILEVDKLHKV